MNSDFSKYNLNKFKKKFNLSGSDTLSIFKIRTSFNEADLIPT